MVIGEGGEIRVKIGDVTAIVNNIIEEMKAEGADLRTAKPDSEGNEKKKASYEVGAQKVGKIMRDMIQLKATAQRSNKGYYVIWDDVKMEIAGKKYGVLPETKEIEAARQAIAALRGKVEQRAPLQMSLDAGDEKVEELTW